MLSLRHFTMNRLTPEQRLQIVVQFAKLTVRYAQNYVQQLGFFCWTATSTSKIVAFGVKKIHKESLLRLCYIHKNHWCALWASGIMGLFFKRISVWTFLVNGERYESTISNFFVFHLNGIIVEELWHNMAHSGHLNHFIERNIWWAHVA